MGGRRSDGGAEEARGEVELCAAILWEMIDLLGDPVVGDALAP